MLSLDITLYRRRYDSAATAENIIYKYNTIHHTRGKKRIQWYGKMSHEIDLISIRVFNTKTTKINNECWYFH